MAIHAVVRTDLMSGTDVRADLVSIKYMGANGSTPTEIDNGNVLKVGSLMAGEREVFVGAVPAANTNRDEVVLIAAPEVMYDERLRNLSDYFNVAGKIVRGYRFRSGNMFAVTAEALEGSFNASNAKGKIVELQASTKMKVVASLTSGSTQVGTIEAVEVAGPYTYFVIKVK